MGLRLDARQVVPDLISLSREHCASLAEGGIEHDCVSRVLFATEVEVDGCIPSGTFRAAICAWTASTRVSVSAIPVGRNLPSSTVRGLSSTRGTPLADCLVFLLVARRANVGDDALNRALSGFAWSIESISSPSHNCASQSFRSRATLSALRARVLTRMDRLSTSSSADAKSREMSIAAGTVASHFPGEFVRGSSA